MRPYTRSLHPYDYVFLRHTGPLREFEANMRRDSVPHREWHEHRLWEYASMMQQLDELIVPKDAKILDIGSGASFFPPYLTVIGGYSNVVLTDSMKYGDIEPMLQIQRAFYDISLPLFDAPCEDMRMLPSDFWDVTMCISTIEHVDDHDAAFSELIRVTRPGGFIFITSDYFRDQVQHDNSPSKHLQATPYTREFVLRLPERFPVDFVGDTDLDYAGDFVHNYSFCNICLRKR